MRSKSMELMLRIKEYIEKYYEWHSSAPTVREIAGAMKIAVSSAHRQAKKDGAVKKAPSFLNQYATPQ